MIYEIRMFGTAFIRSFPVTDYYKWEDGEQTNKQNTLLNLFKLRNERS